MTRRRRKKNLPHSPRNQVWELAKVKRIHKDKMIRECICQEGNDIGPLTGKRDVYARLDGYGKNDSLHQAFKEKPISFSTLTAMKVWLTTIIPNFEGGKHGKKYQKSNEHKRLLEQET